MYKGRKFEITVKYRIGLIKITRTHSNYYELDVTSSTLFEANLTLTSNIFGILHKSIDKFFWKWHWQYVVFFDLMKFWMLLSDVEASWFIGIYTGNEWINKAPSHRLGITDSRVAQRAIGLHSIMYSSEPFLPLMINLTYQFFQTVKPLISIWFTFP